MIHRQEQWFAWTGVGVVALNVLLLFVLIPGLSRWLAPMYNQNLYADSYDLLATNLAEGHGYRLYADTAPTMMREPGYPVFLAAIFRVFGNSLWAVKLANMVLVLAAAWLITRIARRWSSDPIMVVAPPLLFLFHPGTVLSQTRGGVEPLFALLLTLFVLMVYRAIDSNRLVDFAVGGVVLGLAAIVKSTPMLFPVFLFAYLVVFERRLGSPVAIALKIGVMVAAMTAVLSPWIVRNYRLTGRFVPSASVLGISAHAGQYICVNLPSGEAWVDLDRKAARERTSVARTLGYPFKDVEDGYYQSFYSSTDELSFSSYLLGRVVDTYRQSPALFARCSSANLLNFWFAGKTWKSTTLNVIVQLPYLVLAVGGISIAFRRHMGLAIAPCLLFVVYYVAVYVPILAQARYSIPIIPFLSVFAGFALAATRQRLAGRQQVGGWQLDRLRSEGEV